MTAPTSIRALPLLGVLCALAALGLPAAGRSNSAAPSLDASSLILQTTTLTTPTMSHWAAVVRKADVRRLPTVASPVVTRLDTTTGDGTQNIVLALTGAKVKGGGTWYLVRLAILPNNSTGWVPRSALGTLYILHTHLYIDRATQTATLKRDGRTIFTTRIGVGRPYWPTPPGQFYVRDKLVDFHNPFYGPLAFGTSARSAVLTDWPGGGYIGIHGTNEPQLIPGRISHGCIRVPNEKIVVLAKLMPVGTPVTVS
jgi:lipoprotein-anchoring transpeptidase ErfK/SrfK